MKFEIEFKGENKDLGAFLVIIYYISLSFVLMIVYNINMAIWTIFVALVPSIIFNLTKFRIRKIKK